MLLFQSDPKKTLHNCFYGVSVHDIAFPGGSNYGEYLNPDLS